jgi:hypothetical protein
MFVPFFQKMRYTESISKIFSRDFSLDRNRQPRKETPMKTFSQTRATFLDIFAQLERLEGTGKITHAMRTVKERDAGKLCYQAEEDLSQPELSLLRDMLKVRRSNWEAYKQACREGLYG